MLPGVESVNPEVVNFDKFKYYSVNDFHKVYEYTYELETDISVGVLGVDYSCFKGENSMLIEIGDRSVLNRPIVWELNFGCGSFRKSLMNVKLIRKSISRSRPRSRWNIFME